MSAITAKVIRENIDSLCMQFDKVCKEHVERKGPLRGYPYNGTLATEFCGIYYRFVPPANALSLTSIDFDEEITNNGVLKALLEHIENSEHPFAEINIHNIINLHLAKSMRKRRGWSEYNQSEFDPPSFRFVKQNPKQRKYFAPKPCKACPWKRSSKVGGADIPNFDMDMMRNLAGTAPERGKSDDDFRKIFACHDSKEGGECACAGYVARDGQHNISLRLLASKTNTPIQPIIERAEQEDLYNNFHEMFDDYEAANRGE
nr:hypothetical protein VCHA53O474_240088 [Vibrio chagasii]